MHYPSSIKDEYRLAKVIEVFPDIKGRVRTVRIAYRKRDKREKSLPYTEAIVDILLMKLTFQSP